MYLSVDSRKWFYNAYILPHFDYCCVVCVELFTFSLRKMCKTKKRAAIIILDCDYSVPSFVVFSKLKWMTFPERVIYQKAIQMFKTIRGKAPDYLQTYFTLSLDVHTKLLRSSSSYQIYVPKLNLRNTFGNLKFNTSFIVYSVNLMYMQPYQEFLC